MEKLSNEEMIEIVLSRLRNVSSLSFDQAYQVAKYLVESDSVNYSTLFDSVFPPIEAVCKPTAQEHIPPDVDKVFKEHFWEIVEKGTP